MHQHIHHIGLRIETVIKNVFQDHGFGHRPAGVAHEVLEQRELARLQLDGLAAPPHLARE